MPDHVLTITVTSPFDAGPTQLIADTVIDVSFGHLPGWSVHEVSVAPDGADPVAAFAAKLRATYDLAALGADAASIKCLAAAAHDVTNDAAEWLAEAYQHIAETYRTAIDLLDDLLNAQVPSEAQRTIEVV
jgi:hypothetical protein